MNAAFLKSLQAPCDCGLDHTLATKEILVENGALYRLKDLLVGRGMTGSGTVVCDTNTRMAAGELVCQILNDSSRVVLPAEGLHADEKATEAVLSQAPDADYYIAVGSGTIHDITRYVAHKRGVDFVSVPTAASVDGFTSTVAAMTLGGMKVTLPARAPVIVVADLDIIADAPYRLTCAGFGDILGKYTALADWEIAHLVTGEHICRKVVELQAQNIREVVSLRGGLRDGNPAHTKS